MTGTATHPRNATPGRDSPRLIPADAATLQQLADENAYLSLRHLRTWRSTGEVDSWKVCGRVLMSRADVLDRASRDFRPARETVG